MGRAAFPSSRPGRPSSRCRPSGSPTTARSPARSTSSRRRKSRASSRSSAARSTSPTTARPQQKGYAHLTLLAETNEGYSNLIKLSSLGYLEGYYYKPRVDWELLERHGDGLVALSGCLSGRVCKALEEGESRRRRARARPPHDRSSARDNVYVEMQNAHLDVQQRINPLLAQLAEKRGLPIVATGDVHYLRHEDARAHEALLCIQSGDSLKNPNHWKFDTDHFYFKTQEEMLADFPGQEDALRRTLEIAERCNVEIELGRILLPHFPMPDGRDAFDYLVELCEKGLGRRYDTVTPELRERLQFELKTIHEMGFADYFLIVWDFIRFAKRERHQRRPRPRLDRRLARRVLPRDHRPRPDPLRPAVRAVPQPGPQVDARHRHRLRRRGPRARDQLRRREVRHATASRRSSPSGRWPRAPPSATPGACSRSPTASSTRSRSSSRKGRASRLEECLKPGSELREVVRRRPGHARDRRPRAPARGADAPGLDPRRRRRDRRRAADERRAAAAEGRRPGDRDAVLR